MSAFENAKKFFEACDAPKGWDGCKGFVVDGAAFSCQAGALADLKTVQAYCKWMKVLVGGPLPDGRYSLHSSAWDEANSTATFVATFHATHMGEGGPVPPTKKSTSTDYVYSLKMNGEGKVAHMTKVWNDARALKDLGWAYSPGNGGRLAERGVGGSTAKNRS
jgi:hypothetical protein